MAASYMYSVGSNSNSVNYSSINTTLNYMTTPTYTTGTTFTYTTTFNGDPTDPTLFMTPAQRVEHQQKSYLEPRDHAYNADEAEPGWLLGMPCKDCYQHNVHRMSPEKHLFVIQEDDDIDWLSQLAS